MPKRKLFIIGLLLIIGFAVFLLPRMTIEYARVYSPDEKYVAIASEKITAGVIGMFSFGFGDMSGSGFITMESSGGEYLGRVPVDWVYVVNDIEWGDDSASLPAFAEWDFERGTYEYWNSDQTKLTKKQL